MTNIQIETFKYCIAKNIQKSQRACKTSGFVERSVQILV